jgi:hypothetical protein
LLQIDITICTIQIVEVTIDDYGSLKNWIQEALNKKYWNDFIACLLNQQATIPPRPDK